MSTSILYVLKDGQQFGPYPVHDVAQYVAQGSFTLHDLCWQDGWTDWVTSNLAALQG